MDLDEKKNINNDQEMKLYQKVMKTMLAKVNNYTNAELKTKFQNKETLRAFLEEISLGNMSIDLNKVDSRQEIRVYVVLPIWESFPLDVDVNNTVESVKFSIFLKKNICPGTQTLVFEGRPLNDNDTLLARGIKNSSYIYMIEREGEDDAMVLNITGSEHIGDAFSVLVKTWYNILDVKCTIASMVGVYQDKMVLEFEGRELLDHIVVADYDITGNSTLCYTIRDHPNHITIYVESPEADLCDYYPLASNWYVWRLMKTIRQDNGIPVAEQGLFLDGKMLDKFKTFDYYNVCHGDKILCLRMTREN